MAGDGTEGGRLPALSGADIEMTSPMHVVFSAAQIDARVGELAAQIEQDRQGRPIVLLVVLKGAILFAADLMRRLRGEVLLDFFVVSSYAGDGLPSGEVHVLHAPRTDLVGQHVILVDEIVDTGVTIAAGGAPEAKRRGERAGLHAAGQGGRATGPGHARLCWVCGAGRLAGRLRHGQRRTGPQPERYLRCCGIGT